jgi:hypothetical protein
VADESTTRSTELEKKIVADVVVVTLVVASRNAPWTAVAKRDVGDTSGKFHGRRLAPALAGVNSLV